MKKFLQITFGLFLLLGSFNLTFGQTTKAVSLTDDGKFYTLDNGIVIAKIDKDSASIASYKYKNLEMIGPMGIDGFWKLPAVPQNFGTIRQASTLQNPSENKGERATVSVNFQYDGDPAKSVPADIEVRYSLGRGDSGIYLEEIWHHKPEHPKLTFPVGRFVVKLNDDVFDWMTVDSRRSMQMITADDWNHGTVMNMKEARLMNSGVMKGQVEHKYDYAAVQFDTPAYGWSSTKQKIGIWLINPSNEYMSGGATKLELSAHRDATFTDSLTAPAPATTAG